MYRLLFDYTIKNIVELISKENGIEQIAQIYGEILSSEINSNSNLFEYDIDSIGALSAL